MTKKNILFLASHPMTITCFVLPHIRVLRAFFGIRVMANTIDVDLLQQHGVDIPIEPLPLLRIISPWADLKVLWLLFQKIHGRGFSAVHTITPKAGLVGMAAAYLARVPVRVHTFTGQVWFTRTGFARLILKLVDRCIAALATDILVDSPSQRDFLVSQRVISYQRSQVLGPGSICGVDTTRFCPNKVTRHIVREELNTPLEAVVCLFLGRLAPDKGLLDLVQAFAAIADRHSNAQLWIVGPDEANIFSLVQTYFATLRCQLKRIGYTSSPERYMQAADLFCLPSYREGFGSSVIEAAACGLPTLASRIYGLRDAIVEGKTGWMHEAGNVTDLRNVLNVLLSNPQQLPIYGCAAMRYAQEHYNEEVITGAMKDFYLSRLHETRL